MSAGFEGKVVVVAGASGDLGSSITAAFMANKAQLCTLSRLTPPSFEGSLDLIVDFLDSSALEETIQRVVDRFGRIDVLINAVGVSQNKLALSQDRQEAFHLFEANFFGAMELTRLAAREMVLQKSGTMIHLSSAASRHPRQGQATYAASKAALQAYVSTAAKELGPKGVRVNAIAPGFIKSRMTSNLPIDERAKVLKEIPLARMGMPQDVANLTLFLASAEAGYITGQTIYIDGGLTI